VGGDVICTGNTEEEMIQIYQTEWVLKKAQERWIKISWIKLFESHTQIGWQQHDSFSTNNSYGSRY
jgi:hypothetical protein